MDHSYSAMQEETDATTEKTASELCSVVEPVPWSGTGGRVAVHTVHRISSVAASSNAAGIAARIISASSPSDVLNNHSSSSTLSDAAARRLNSATGRKGVQKHPIEEAGIVARHVFSVSGASDVEEQPERASSTPVAPVPRPILKDRNRRDAIARAFSPEQQIIINSMQREIDQLRKRDKIKTKQIALQRTMLEMLGGDPETSNLRSSIEFKPLETQREVEDLNEKLGNDAETRAKMENWLKLNIIGRDIKNRLHEAIDLIFSRPLFSQCSWTGAGTTEKISLAAQTNILALMKKDAGEVGNVSDAFFKSFMQRKIKYAKKRINIIGAVRTSCHLRHF